MSELKFYLKGAFDGDGHYYDKRTIQINVIDYDFLEYIQTIIKKEFNKEVKIKNYCKAKGNSKAQFRINFHLKIDEGNFDEFRSLIPTTRQEKIQYLRGLLDAEGSVGMCKKKVRNKNGKVYDGNDKWLTLAQKDITKLDLWASYMDELEIFTNKIYRDDGRSYLSIRRNDSIKKFAELIGFRIKRKQERLSQLIKNLSQSQLSEVDKAKIVSIYTQTNFGSEYIAKMFGRTKPAILSILRNRNINTSKYRQRKINHNDIDIVEGLLGRELPFKLYQSKIQIFSSKGLQTSKIKSIKFHLRTKGVDLITEKNHNFFLSNGVICHNSTMAQQVGYYVAWLLAGGKKKPKKKEVPFGNSNIVFTPDALVEIAQRLPKKSVIIYDEGRAGLDSIRAMENINKGMMDFFQECGQYQHVIIIVLPNYFRLSEDIAIPRSLFLIDVYHDSKYNRGYLKFYNEIQKEYLYVFGKKKLGTYAKYNSANPSFSGKFTNMHPQIDIEKYDNEKKESFRKKQVKKELSDRMSKKINTKFNMLCVFCDQEGHSNRAIGNATSTHHTDIGKRIKNFREGKEIIEKEEDLNPQEKDSGEADKLTPSTTLISTHR